ncbi:MAG: hypothetical protein ACXIU7_06455 [Roseinatronobacter sp.]
MIRARALERALWAGPLADTQAPARAFAHALEEGAEYGQVLRGLRHLWRLGLPAADLAMQARARWPRAIDMAVSAVDHAPATLRAGAFSHLHACVALANRRRAALANALLRHGQFQAARAALSPIDQGSTTACDDLARRIELALLAGDFGQAVQDLEMLEQWGADSARLRLRLIWRRDGAGAVARHLDTCPPDTCDAAREAFEIAIAEGDFTRAPAALEQWSDAVRAVDIGSDATPRRADHDAALARACTRLALEQGALARVQALLAARLVPDAPWTWDATDHVQWMRCGMLDGAAPAALWSHAQAALRLFPRHEGLAHLARQIETMTCDWREIAARPALPFAIETPLAAGRAALRLGLPARACRAAAQLRDTDMPGLRFRAHALRAEAFWSAGRVSAAWAVHAQMQAQAVDALARAEAAILAVELALSAADPARAAPALEALEAACPDRMVTPLLRARLAFLQGDFAQAQAAHARFNRLKAAQTGTSPAPDLRDLITDDACRAVQGLGAAFAPDQTVVQTLAWTGAARPAASAALSACLIARAQAQGLLGRCETAPRITSVPDIRHSDLGHSDLGHSDPDRAGPGHPIPLVLAHYWQGPEGPAVPRARTRWKALHPALAQQVFDAPRARDWLLAAYGASMATRFERLTQPALRADLFRAAWIAQEGGVFADLDEWPRLPVTPWLQGVEAVFCVERGFGTIANNFLAARPAHPICLQALDLICAALDDAAQPYAWWHSGPAQWTRAVAAPMLSSWMTAGASGAGSVGAGAVSLLVLSPAAYAQRVATNLPYPHKRSADHWR